jgi:hypothetical protein
MDSSSETVEIADHGPYPAGMTEAGIAEQTSYSNTHLSPAGPLQYFKRYFRMFSCEISVH